MTIRFLPQSASQGQRSLRSLLRQRRERSNASPEDKSLPQRLLDVFLRTWDLGFTAFGGPPVHFRIIHERFVEGKGGKEKWVDEDIYQELFAICQGLPGPASTKMLFCLVFLHAGLIPAIFVFFLWSLPGALGMYGFSLGVQKLNETLPTPVYSLLSGLNASSVGIIALAAVQLAEKAIKNQLTRILVILGACAGLCYNALWYFPLLISIGGIVTVIWDGWMSQKVGRIKAKLRRIRNAQNTNQSNMVESVTLEERSDEPNIILRRNVPSTAESRQTAQVVLQSSTSHLEPQIAAPENIRYHSINVKVGVAFVIIFFTSFTGILVARGITEIHPLPLDLFANMYLAGTIIFGGGPVVIPLLRSYVVDPGWVSGRDFLLGLALIQAFPGPNFNFAVYLGALALQNTQFPTIFGAFLGYLGIFLPGIALALAVQGFWRVLRTKKWVVDLLRGVNATAIGLVFTAVYRLWEIGYLTPEKSSGQSLGMEPWWLVLAVVAYAGNAWFNVPAAVAILIGGALGLCWYGAVGKG